MAPRRLIPTPIGLSRRRGQVLMAGNNRRMPGYTPPSGGNTDPNGPQNQPAPTPAQPQLSNLAQHLQAGNLPDRFGRFGINNNGKIVDQGHGMYTPEQAAQYQHLFNAAQQAGVNIVGQSGEGGGYNPNVLYAQPNRYVDLRTGLANPPNTGASTDSAHTISPDALARLRENSGYDPAQAAATAHSMAVGAGPGGGLSQWQLGSDGQYHNPNQPMPPGVDLTPPEGATAPLTNPVDQVATAGHATPQAALAAGKDPTKHVAYWESQGWTYNPATDQWTNRNQGQNGGTTDPNGPQTPPAQPSGGDTGAGVPGGVPLDPAYIAQQRMIQNQLNQTLQGTNPALEQIAAQQALAQARLGTNQSNDQQALMESLAGRGVLDSSLYGTNLGNLATNYLRQNQDLAGNVAQAYGGVYQDQQNAYNQAQQQLVEALIAASNNAATSTYTPVAGNTRRPRKPKKNRGGRRG